MDGYKIAKRAGIGIAAVFGLAVAALAADERMTDKQDVIVAGGYFDHGEQTTVFAMNEKGGGIESFDNLSGAANLPGGRYHAEIGCKGVKALGLTPNRCIVRASRFE